MKKILIVFFLLAVNLVFGQKYESIVFPVDTLVDTETMTLNIHTKTNMLNKSAVAYAIHVDFNAISGTAANDIKLQGSQFESGDFWDDISTLTTTADADTTFTDDYAVFRRLRLYRAQTGTQTNYINVAVQLRRREN